MELFLTTLSRMGFLFIFLACGYLICKLKLIPDNSQKVLSKLENMLFIPALMLGTFMNQFTVEKLGTAGRILILSVILEIIIIPLAIVISGLIYGKGYLKKIATYGLSFANFGFMGNAVMQELFPEIFLEYTVFTLPLWIFIMLWGVPYLLMADDGEKKLTLLQRLKPLLNPMLIAMLVGMILGLSGISSYVPAFCTDAIDTMGSLMSPIAMILTGITVANSSIVTLLSKKRVYLLSVIRLLAFPLVFMGIFSLVPTGAVIDQTFLITATAAISMPLGLNTIVVPGAYGKDTTDAASMALISHAMSIVTIPLIFMLFTLIFGT